MTGSRLQPYCNMGDDSNAPALLNLVSSFLGPPATVETTRSAPRALTDTATPSTGRANDANAPNIIPSSTTDVQHGTPIACNATVVVFSKDRPWQLQQLIRSMKLSLDPSAGPQQIIINVVVIARRDEFFSEGYQKVEDEFTGNHKTERAITFLYEDAAIDKTFGSLLEKVICNTVEDQADNTLVMFLTDDCLLLEPIEKIIFCAASCLSSTPRALAFLSRLHPAISWCQTRNVPCPPPREEMRYVAHKVLRAQPDAGAYVFDRKVGVADWSYPFDLSGGIYRRSDVVTILDWIRERGQQDGKLSYSHPNRLEVSGNIAISVAEKGNSLDRLSSIVGQCSLNAVPTRPFLVILAINRVQDVCSAPLALKNGEDDKTGTEMNYQPSALLKFLQDGKHLDEMIYRSSHFNASHLGDLNFIGSKTELLPEADAGAVTRISVLIPVKMGPPKYAAHAIKSILMQPVEELEEHSCDLKDEALMLSPMQIVIVDDRCRDGSIDEMISAATLLFESKSQVSLVIRDFRSSDADSTAPIAKPAPRDTKVIRISIDIVASERNGIASALNYGLRFCSSDVVARMDADDVSCPHRLLSQVRALRYRPDLNVVGTCSLLFCEQTNGKGKHVHALPYTTVAETPGIDILRSSVPSSDPGFVSWAMLFSCCVSHPSVVFRRKIIQQVGTYDESISRAEDYDLWNRLLQQHPHSIASIPNIGIFHRKHCGSSTSGKYSAQQSLEANDISLRAMQSVLSYNDTELDIKLVTTIKKPDDALSASDLDKAAVLLSELESSFLRDNSNILTEREEGLIRLDCDARIGELASICIRKFGRNATSGLSGSSGAWQIWVSRCPDQNLERISLLCHTCS